MTVRVDGTLMAATVSAEEAWPCSRKASHPSLGGFYACYRRNVQYLLMKKFSGMVMHRLSTGASASGMPTASTQKTNSSESSTKGTAGRQRFEIQRYMLQKRPFAAAEDAAVVPVVGIDHADDQSSALAAR